MWSVPFPDIANLKLQRALLNGVKKAANVHELARFTPHQLQEYRINNLFKASVTSYSSLMYSQFPRNWKVVLPKIRICIPLRLWKINLLGWYFVFHWDQGKTDWVLMLKYLKLLCRFREYLQRDFCIKNLLRKQIFAWQVLVSVCLWNIFFL